MANLTVSKLRSKTSGSEYEIVDASARTQLEELANKTPDGLEELKSDVETLKKSSAGDMKEIYIADYNGVLRAKVKVSNMELMLMNGIIGNENTRYGGDSNDDHYGYFLDAMIETIVGQKVSNIKVMCSPSLTNYANAFATSSVAPFFCESSREISVAEGVLATTSWTNYAYLPYMPSQIILSEYNVGDTIDISVSDEVSCEILETIPSGLEFSYKNQNSVAYHYDAHGYYAEDETSIYWYPADTERTAEVTGCVKFTKTSYRPYSIYKFSHLGIKPFNLFVCDFDGENN